MCQLKELSEEGRLTKVSIIFVAGPAAKAVKALMLSPSQATDTNHKKVMGRGETTTQEHTKPWGSYKIQCHSSFSRVNKCDNPLNYL